MLVLPAGVRAMSLTCACMQVTILFWDTLNIQSGPLHKPEDKLPAPGLRRWPSLPADGVFDLSMRLTAGFAHRLQHPPGLLPAAFAAWAQLAARRRASMCAQVSLITPSFCMAHFLFHLQPTCIGHMRPVCIAARTLRWLVFCMQIVSPVCFFNITSAYRGRVLLAASRWQRRRLRLALLAWQLGARLNRRTRALLGRAAARRRLRMLAATLRVWRSCCAARRRLRHLGARAAAAVDRIRVRAAFRGWARELGLTLARTLAKTLGHRGDDRGAHARVLETPGPTAAPCHEGGAGARGPPPVVLTPNPLYDMAGGASPAGAWFGGATRPLRGWTPGWTPELNAAALPSRGGTDPADMMEGCSPCERPCSPKPAAAAELTAGPGCSGRGVPREPTPFFTPVATLDFRPVTALEPQPARQVPGFRPSASPVPAAPLPLVQPVQSRAGNGGGVRAGGASTPGGADGRRKRLLVAAWQGFAAAGVAAQERACLARAHHARCRAAAALQGWRGAAVCARAGRHAKVRVLRSALRAWAGYAHRRIALHCRADHLRRVRADRVMARVLSSWRAAAGAARKADSAAVCVLRARMAARALEALFGAWRAAARVRRLRCAAVQAFRGQAEGRLRARVWRAWHEHVERREAKWCGLSLAISKLSDT